MRSTLRLLAACFLAASFSGCASDFAYWTANCERMGFVKDTSEMSGCIDAQWRQASAATAATMSIIPRQVQCRQIGAFVQCY